MIAGYVVVMACARDKDDKNLRHRLTVGAVATAGIAGLGLAPVGLAGAATPGSGTPTNPVSAAVAAMSGSEHFTMELSVAASVPGTTGSSFGLTASGVLDNPAGTPHGVGQTPGLAAADLHLHVATLGTVDLRELGGVLYVHLPATLAAKIPGTAAKPWLAVNLAALRAKLGASPSRSSSLTTMPGNVLSALGTVATVTRVGTATIRNTPTTEYVADLQIAKLAAIDPALSAVQAAKLEAALPNGTMPIAIWLDAEGRVRQVHLRLVLPVPIRSTPATGTVTGTTSGASGTGTAGTGPGGPAGTAVTPTGTVTVSYTMDLFDYGPAATFSVPPPGQVQDVTKELEAALPAGASGSGSAAATIGGLLGGGLGASGSSGTGSTGTGSTGTGSTGTSTGG